MSHKLSTCVLFGGISTEHEISRRSADTVLKALDPEKYNVIMVGIKRDGSWLRYQGPIEDIFGGEWEQHPDNTPVVAPCGTATPGLLELTGEGTVSHDVDVWIPCLHGIGGEDGTIQGLLELTGIPYVGCGVLSSALCMDKATTYGIVEEHGIACPASRTTTGEASREELEKIAEALGFPIFVKPANGGSSIGVSKAHDMAELIDAEKTARGTDNKVVYESFIEGYEISCGVMGNSNTEPLTGVPDELWVKGGGVAHLHLEKNPGTNQENSVISCPPDHANDGDIAKVKEAALAIYAALGCEGFARVDLFLTPEHEVVFNEVNTFPGMTYYSRFPRQFRAAGYEIPFIMDTLIDLAIQRHNAKPSAGV